MRGITKKFPKISWRYTINYVYTLEYSVIVDELKTRGVAVETKDIDIFVNTFKKRIAKTDQNLIFPLLRNNMKIYRCSFWSTALAFPMLIATVVSLAIIVPSLIDQGFSWLKIVKAGLAIYSFPFCLLLFSGFYIILRNNVLIVKNIICPFWKKKVCLNDIVKIKIIHPGGNAIPYIQIFTGKTKWGWRYYLDHVRYKDLLELVNLLREKDVEVKAKVWKGLDDNDYLE